ASNGERDRVLHCYTSHDALNSVLLTNDLDVIRLRLHQIPIVALEEIVELRPKKRCWASVNFPSDEGSRGIMYGAPINLARQARTSDQVTRCLVTLHGILIARIRFRRVDQWRLVEQSIMHRAVRQWPVIAPIVQNFEDGI